MRRHCAYVCRMSRCVLLDPTLPSHAQSEWLKHTRLAVIDGVPVHGGVFRQLPSVGIGEFPVYLEPPGSDDDLKVAR